MEIPMKRTLVAAVLAAMAVSLALSQASSSQETPKDGDNASLVDTFTKIENEWAEADKTMDAKALGKLLGADWFFLGPQGTETKAQHLEGLKKGDENIESITLMDMKVRVYGDIAVVTGREHEKSTKKNVDTTGDYLYTDVFVKRHGQWQAVNSQDTPLTHK